MIPRPKSEPSVPWTSKPEPAKGWVKPSWIWTITPERHRQTDMTPSSTPSPMPERAGQRHDLDRVVAEHEAQRVGVVHGDVEDHAAAGRRRR